MNSRLLFSNLYHRVQNNASEYFIFFLWFSSSWLLFDSFIRWYFSFSEQNILSPLLHCTKYHIYNTILTTLTSSNIYKLTTSYYKHLWFLILMTTPYSSLWCLLIVFCPIQLWVLLMVCAINLCDIISYTHGHGYLGSIYTVECQLCEWDGQVV